MDSINNILIPYDCMFDTDIGLFRLISSSYANESVFDLKKIESDTQKNQVVLSEKYDNPLDVILKPEYKDINEKFYKEFLEQESERITRLALPTNILEIAVKLRSSGMGKVDFLVSNEYQSDNIKSVFGENVVIINDDLEKIDLRNYDIIFLRRIKDIIHFKNLEGKYIYILDYNFNLENDRKDNEPMPLLQYILSSFESNVLRLISPYNL